MRASRLTTSLRVLQTSQEVQIWSLMKTSKKMPKNKKVQRNGSGLHPMFGGIEKLGTASGQQQQTIFRAFWNSGDYGSAKNVALDFAKNHPNVAGAWADAAACCIYLSDWDGAVRFAMRSHKLDPNLLSALDALSHGYCCLLDYSLTKKYGHMALFKRDQVFGSHSFASLENKEFSRDVLNGVGESVISFSLFGSDPKYCEPAVINAQMQSDLYPAWVCRFYVDHSVPQPVISRLRKAGAQVLYVDDEMNRWPGTMWRFAAYDDPNVKRVIFRDCDSVISSRESAAVEEWCTTNYDFHVMRDFGSHCELMLAGLWGVRRGAMPMMRDMISNYLKASQIDLRFADQYFLRQYVWPYARNSILQHDSLFAFMNHKPFPNGAYEPSFHVGSLESASYFEVDGGFAGQSSVSWSIWHVNSLGLESFVCEYDSNVMDGRFVARIPNRYISKEFLLRVNGTSIVNRLA